MRVVAVVPAFNEEKTVGQVVETLCSSNLVQDVVVVSDGSADRTAERAKEAGARVIELEENLGKGGAMRVGVRSAAADIVLFLDADLIGLSEEHIAGLIVPVVRGEADMTIGLFESGRSVTDIAQVFAPQLSGQRAVRKAILSRISDMEVSRFGVEMALTRFAKRARLRVREVPLKGMTHVMKEEKMGFSRGFVARMKMYWEIVRALAAGKG